MSPTEQARNALRDSIAALERTRGEDRRNIETTLERLRQALGELDAVIGNSR